MLVGVAVLAALVVDAAARLVRFVAGDNRVADRQPSIMVVNAAAVIRLTDLIVGLALDVGRVNRAGLDRLNRCVGFITLFSNEVGKIGRRNRHEILANATVLGIARASDRRIAISGAFHANVVGFADVEPVDLEVFEEGIVRIDRAEKVARLVIDLNEQIKIGVVETLRTSVGVGVGEVRA